MPARVTCAVNLVGFHAPFFSISIATVAPDLFGVKVPYSVTRGSIALGVCLTVIESSAGAALEAGAGPTLISNEQAITRDLNFIFQLTPL